MHVITAAIERHKPVALRHCQPRCTPCHQETDWTKPTPTGSVAKVKRSASHDVPCLHSLGVLLAPWLESELCEPASHAPMHAKAIVAAAVRQMNAVAGPVFACQHAVALHLSEFNLHTASRDTSMVTMLALAASCTDAAIKRNKSSMMLLDCMSRCGHLRSERLLGLSKLRKSLLSAACMCNCNCHWSSAPTVHRAAAARNPAM